MSAAPRRLKLNRDSAAVIVLREMSYLDAVASEPAAFQGFLQVRDALLDFVRCVDAAALEWQQRASFDKERPRFFFGHTLEALKLNRCVVIEHAFMDFELHLAGKHRSRQRFSFRVSPFEA